MSDVVPAHPFVADAPVGSGVAQQVATRAAFFIAGFCNSTWAPLVPYAKDRLRLGDGQLGLMLLCFGIGSILSMPLAGPLAGRYGCRRVIVSSALLVTFALPALAVVNQVPLMAIALLCFGAGFGTLDVTMNLHATLVERDSGRTMMSGFHGLYSVGGIAGAGLVSVLVALHVPLLGAILAAVGVSVAVQALSFTSLLPAGDQSGPAFAIPHGRVLLLGICCFVLFLAEASVLDWGGVFLKTFRHADAAHAGLAYVAFATAMTVCRLTGNTIVRVIGPTRTVFFGCLIAAGGFGLALAAPSTIASIAGFGLVGIGAANVVPVLYSAAGGQTVMPVNLAIAATATLGYAGILTGPALIGLVAHATNLTAGIGAVAGLLVIVAVLSTRAKL